MINKLLFAAATVILNKAEDLDRKANPGKFNKHASQDDTEEIRIAGGKIFRGAKDPRLSGCVDNFTGIVNGQQFVEGQAVPNGGYFDFDGYHAPDGKVYK